MANNSKIKQAARKRVFELVAATEHEISAGKTCGKNIKLLEELLSCLLSLQERDLPRFRLSEWALAGGISPQSRCKTNNLNAECAADNSVFEMIYGRQPATTHGDICKSISTYLSGGKRVLVIAPTVEKLVALMAPIVRLLQEAPAPQPHSVITVSADAHARYCRETDLDVIIDELSAESDAAFSELRAERTELSKTCDDILAILTARSALAQEIALLNLIHVRCDELTSLNQSLSTHLKELELSIAKLQSVHAQRLTPWQLLWNRLTSAADKESNALRLRQRELAHVRRRLERSEQEADQLTLEMASRQAFITETTRHVLRRLAQYAPSFAEAVNLVTQNRKRIREIDKRLKEWPSTRSAEGLLSGAGLVGISAGSLFDRRLHNTRFDMVVIDGAQSLPLAFIYWACSYATSGVGFGLGGANTQSLSSSEPASFWFGRTIVEQLILDRACAIKSGWSPVAPSTASATIAETGTGKM
ncbi:MAG TPA: hypothetical protein V6D22_03985 [Candidatus Obscuribacterales bacterium]